MLNILPKGILFALLAAALNGSIGIFSKLLMVSGLAAEDIAFFKTIIAFALLSILLLRPSHAHQKNYLSHISQNATTISTSKLICQIAVCAFLGIFVLYFFETLAYQYGYAANVVVILMASAAVVALIGGKLFLQENITPLAMIGTLLAIAGIFMISWTGHSSLALILNGILAGAGYGLFSVLLKKFKLIGGLYLTHSMLIFGSLFLFFPFILQYQPITLSGSTTLFILILALLPTIGGFFCTTKALNYLSPAKVQITELSEPIFTMIFAMIILGETPTYSFFIGATLIILDIFSINHQPKAD